MSGKRLVRERSCTGNVRHRVYHTSESCKTAKPIEMSFALRTVVGPTTTVYERVCNERKLAYLVHRSIIFDSCFILGMLIKDVMPSIIFDSCLTSGMLIKGVTCRLRRTNAHTRRPTVHVRPRVRAYSAGGDARDISTAGRVDRD